MPSREPGVVRNRILDTDSGLTAADRWTRDVRTGEWDGSSVGPGRQNAVECWWQDELPEEAWDGRRWAEGSRTEYRDMHDGETSCRTIDRCCIKNKVAWGCETELKCGVVKQ